MRYIGMNVRVYYKMYGKNFELCSLCTWPEYNKLHGIVGKNEPNQMR